MKVLNILGWLFVPFIMIFFKWNSLKGPLKVGAIAWASLALIIGFSSALTDQETTTNKQTVTSKTEGTKNTDTAKEVLKEEPKEQVKETPKDEPKKELKQEVKKNDPGISMAEFKQLKTGMSYEKAVKIIGGAGEVMSESGTPGGTGLNTHTIMYMWEGEDGWGANANAMFQGNKLQNKAQFGLE